MPELPEVEMVRRTLLPLVVGKTIERVKVHWSKIIQHPDVATFCECLKGQTIHDIQRRGKFLLFQLDDVVLVSHLRMEGRYIYEKEDTPFDQHTHIFLHSQIRRNFVIAMCANLVRCIYLIKVKNSVSLLYQVLGLSRSMSNLRLHGLQINFNEQNAQ